MCKKIIKMYTIRNSLLFFALSSLIFSSCSTDDGEMETSNSLLLSGRIIFVQAGDLFIYNLATGRIDFIAERKGRQGPFFSPDGQYFTTNNWPGNNEGVAVWKLEQGSIEKEFALENTLDQNELGIKVSAGASFFSGIVNSAFGENPDLILLDEKGTRKFQIDGDRMRVKGHAWDSKGYLYFTGEVLEGSLAGMLFMGKMKDFETVDVKVIRTFEGEFSELPDEMSISSDGSQIAYAYKNNIWIGSTGENSENHRECFDATQTLATPAFSPDGAYLAMVMLNSSVSLRGDLHIAKIPEQGLTTLTIEGPSKLDGPNSSINSTFVSGEDSSMGWFE